MPRIWRSKCVVCPCSSMGGHAEHERCLEFTWCARKAALVSVALEFHKPRLFLARVARRRGVLAPRRKKKPARRQGGAGGAASNAWWRAAAAVGGAGGAASNAWSTTTSHSFSRPVTTAAAASTTAHTRALSSPPQHLRGELERGGTRHSPLCAARRVARRARRARQRGEGELLGSGRPPLLRKVAGYHGRTLLAWRRQGPHHRPRLLGGRVARRRELG